MITLTLVDQEKSIANAILIAIQQDYVNLIG